MTRGPNPQQASQHVETKEIAEDSQYLTYRSSDLGNLPQFGRNMTSPNDGLKNNGLKNKGLNSKGHRGPRGWNRRDLFVQAGAWWATSLLGTGRSNAGPNDPSAPTWLGPAEDRFDELRSLYNTRLSPKPARIAPCRSVDQIAVAIRQAADRGVRVSVRSGGHSFEGFSCADQSWVIHLSNSKRLKLDARTGLLHAGPGVRLSELYDYLLPKKLIVPAGSCGGVGLAGLALGGGYGMFSRQMGLTCDHLEGVALVDGRGRRLDSNDDPELLWACRGGGNGNFGVAHELRFRCLPAPKHLQRFRLRFRGLDADRAVELAKRWFEAADRLPREAFSAFVLNRRTLTVLLVGTFVDHPKVVSAVRRLKAGASAVATPRTAPLASALKNYYGRAKPLWFKNVSAGFYSGFDQLKDVLPEIFERITTGRDLIFQINTLGGAVGDVASNATSFPHRRLPYLGELQAYPTRPDRQERALRAVGEIQGLLSRAGVAAHYRNYPDVNLADWQQAYWGAEGYRRLQRIKQRLDPQDLFHHPQSVRLPT